MTKGIHCHKREKARKGKCGSRILTDLSDVPDLVRPTLLDRRKSSVSSTVVLPILFPTATRTEPSRKALRLHGTSLRRLHSGSENTYVENTNRQGKSPTLLERTPLRRCA